MAKKINDYFEKVLHWLGKRNWGVMVGVLFFMVFLEIFELLHKGEPFYDPFHLVELLFTIFILMFMGILINYSIKANVAQQRTMEILKYKHDLSLELAELENWDMLISKLVKLPGTIAPIEASWMHVCNPVSGQMEDVARWTEKGAEISTSHQDCQKCLKEHSETDSLFKLYCSSTNLEAADGTTHPKEYCLSIASAKSLLGRIQFQLKIGEDLSDEQKEIFENIRPEIAWALKVAREQKILSEMRLAEKTLAERRSLSEYLHDNLNQNLAYLRLKLDQFTTGGEPFSVENVQIDLQHMKDAANQSYNIVRGMIEAIHPETTPCMVNLFNQHAKKVSERAHIEISIETKGDDLPILPEIQQAVFYVFQEVLSNVEKHARAENVKVLVDWGECNLTVSISDDGVGFDPQNLDGSKHFGLEIIQERIDKVNGRIDICSSANAGTEVTVFVPVVSPEKEGISDRSG